MEWFLVAAFDRSRNHYSVMKRLDSLDKAERLATGYARLLKAQGGKELGVSSVRVLREEQMDEPIFEAELD